MQGVYLSEFNVSTFIDLIKFETGFNDKAIASYLGVSKSLVCGYKKNIYPLSEDSFLRLCSLAHLEYQSFTYNLYKPRNHGITPFLPELDSKLAEFVGIILGDGHLSKDNHGIIITCGLIDFPYICGYIPALIFELFGKKASFKIVESKGIGMQSLFYSKSASLFLHTHFKIPLGKKQNHAIPIAFFQNKSLLSACLRGLIDTDGGFYRHNNKSAQICFYNSSPSLLDSVEKAFFHLGFSPYFYWNTKRDRGVLSISGSDIYLFMNQIGLHNPKNILKYQIFLRTNFVPKNENIKSLIFGLSTRESLKNGKSLQSSYARVV